MAWHVFDAAEYINLYECLYSGQVFSFLIVNDPSIVMSFQMYLKDSIECEMNEFQNKEDQIVYNQNILKKNLDESISNKKLLFCATKRFKIDYINTINHDFTNAFKTLTYNQVGTVNIYEGLINKKTFFLTEHEKRIFYKTEHDDPKIALNFFFGTHLNYNNIFYSWNDSMLHYNGLRLLHIEPIENIFSFICSQNNNIKRIGQMVCYLSKKSNCFTELNFSEEDLKANKFGYRARYVIEACKILKEKQNNLKVMSKEELSFFLLGIKGIGRKVRDCILLMGFAYYDVVPIDVHIFKSAKKMFSFHEKRLTDKNYKEIQKMYKDKFGKFCGIVQLYLFKNELNKNKW